jgi:hypothetical protein
LNVIRWTDCYLFKEAVASLTHLDRLLAMRHEAATIGQPHGVLVWAILGPIYRLRLLLEHTSLLGQCSRRVPHCPG